MDTMSDWEEPQPRRAGRPAADTHGLVDAAVWLIHLAPARPASCSTLADVADLLLGCKQPAVTALVGRAGSKTLCNRLAPYRREILLLEWPAIVSASQWAEKADLPTRDLEEFA